MNLYLPVSSNFTPKCNLGQQASSMVPEGEDQGATVHHLQWWVGPTNHGFTNQRAAICDWDPEASETFSDQLTL